jgi:hypothetical protein
MSPKPDKVRYLERRWLRRRKDVDTAYDIFGRKGSVMSDVPKFITRRKISYEKKKYLN